MEKAEKLQEQEDEVLVNATWLFKVVKDRLHFWRTADGEPYVEVTEKGQRIFLPIKSEAFRTYLYAQVPDKLLTSHAVNEIVFWATATAKSAPVEEAWMRVGKKEGCIYYDLGDRSVRITSLNWEVGGEGPRFIRTPAMLGQVEPCKTSRSLQDLLGSLVNATPHQIDLMAGWLVGAMMPGGPYPVLIINGEEGTAKTTATRLLRRIVDPHELDIRPPPKTARDLIAQVKNSYVFALDNVSSIRQELSDSLCRLATGAPMGGRQLYSDYYEAAFPACRPVILNGIPEFVEMPDLMSRSINIQLSPIDSTKRIDDVTFWQKVDEVLPEIMGALFSSVSRALANYDKVKLPNLPRMATFMRWCCAAFGEDWAETFSRVEKESVAHLIEHDTIAQALITFMEGKDTCTMTAQLWLDHLVTTTPTLEFWPKTVKQFMNRLDRIKGTLKKTNFVIIRHGRERKTGRTILEIRRSETTKSP